MIAPPTEQRVTVVAERNARRALGAGAAISAVGVALVGMVGSDVGTALCIAGLLILIFGIHTFGRLGPEPAQ
ncbi:MAG: hypothetical protein IPK82_27225 [Polyangiaceae bacterium]|nr:hypothetical protein [Polyangiaceae bacterium]